jgi:ribosome biogenesis protein Nip4
MIPMNFRALKNSEFEFIQAALIQISPRLVSYVQIRRSFLFTSISGKRNKNLVYMITENIKNIQKKLQKKVDLISAGTYLGFLRMQKFFLSLEGAEYFFKEKLIPDQIIIRVSKEGEKSILYGNPIERRMILDNNYNVKKGSIVLILNQFNELVALGHAEVALNNLKSFKEREILISNLIDKGYYLRRAQ